MDVSMTYGLACRCSVIEADIECIGMELSSSQKDFIGPDEDEP